MPFSYFDALGIFVGILIGGWISLLILKFKKKKAGKKSKLQFIEKYGEDFEVKINEEQEAIEKLRIDSRRKKVSPSKEGVKLPLRTSPGDTKTPKKKKKVVKKKIKKKVKRGKTTSGRIRRS